MKNKIYDFLKIVACICIVFIGLNTFYTVNKLKNNLDTTIFNDNIEKNINITNEKYNNKKPYKVILFSSSKSYDVTNVEELYKNVDIIVTGKVIEKRDAQINEIIPSIHTGGSLEVFNIIKGSIPDNNINFIVLGGKISIYDYENFIKNNYQGNLEKEDFSYLDTDFKKQNYILYKDEYSNDFYNNQDYLMFLNKIKNTDEYAVISYAGMIPVNDASIIKSIDQIYSLEKVKKD